MRWNLSRAPLGMNFRTRIAVVAMLLSIAYGCATSKAPAQTKPEALHGIASWYGEEFAGRTTANGEIFDPVQLTAAHRTLPFGTVVDVTNAKTQQTVRVRINDRGPYIGNRVLDLSYAAAQKIGLIEPGTGEVNIAIVKLGNGEREAPAPFEATIAAAPPVEVAPAPPVVAAAPPEVEIPIPKEEPEPVIVSRVQVEEDGRTLTRPAPPPPPPSSSSPAPVVRTHGLYVQVGAFSVEANANALLDRLTSIGQKAWIAHDDLYRVRLGPFSTREEAVKARSALEAQGISAIIVAE